MDCHGNKLPRNGGHKKRAEGKSSALFYIFVISIPLYFHTSIPQKLQSSF